MPIDLKTAKALEETEREKKKHPRDYKRKEQQNLVHWVVVDARGHMHGRLFNSKTECESLLAFDPTILTYAPIRFQKLICYPSITCHCSEFSNFVKYVNHQIVYRCKNNHETKISEYD